MKAFLAYLATVAGTSAIFFFAPQLDLATSRLFYDPGRGFVLASWPPILFLFRAIPWIAWHAASRGGRHILAPTFSPAAVAA
jgi:hypothetical protein